ncbi:lytic transglycosylase domain-containing protein [Rhizobium sp. TRM96647]|uniref:lytic transglycosylase domain-containing protein n=1 Tax=unclassified Rhizobium TaxID=2613769 RepID=UPI0021E87B62|nr:MULTISPECIES: lytic transglycosylase domain-containing protein [unclassified Rhizobium]MCV3738535.1 lytic transglycosylase domain-containing protein [Rhizobium sp. TRM96647]MCV3760222.1 lytic transglycosylase domain-containing protein [Rhizobium sp. TRM96650]
MTRTTSYAAIILLATAAIASSAQAGTVPDDRLPLPRTRPLGFAAGMPAHEAMGAIESVTGTDAVSEQLKDGLDALSNRDPAEALRIRNTLQQDSLDRHILTWAIAVSGQSGVPSFEIATAQKTLKGWPGLKSLRANSERALARENPAPDAVIAAFGTTRAETVDGAMALARARIAKGDQVAALDTLRPYWHADALDRDTETKILTEFGPLLTVADHRRRMEMLLYRERTQQAQRFGDLAESQSLYRAWAAVIGKAKNADALVKAVDPSWHKDPAYAFLRAELANRAEKYALAAELLSKGAPGTDDKAASSAWWVEQRIASRGLTEQGNYAAAYRLVAHHAAKSETDTVEAEFHAGWYALRGLKDPKTASTHFQKILRISNRPLAVSRAWYWMGRAAEAEGSGQANEYFVKAANFGGTYYGQLAAARIGQTGLNVAYPTPSPEDRARFQSREAVRAIDRLAMAGHGWRAASLYRALAEELQSPGELALLAARSETGGDHQLSLQIGKIAFGRGIDVAALAFPVGVIPASANISGSGKALAYAIARQESAFNPAAVSPANARGLLQLLPGTAKGVAKRYGLAYSAEKLTSDAAYNATLGAHFLGEQISDFDGSYILTFIAYNAGPRRVGQWIARYGDPRGKPIDEVVDWVEKIPFSETRSYVQRVMENYQVYKTRLGQKADIVHDLRVGRS